MLLPKYPVYVPTKGRSATPYTINFLLKDGVPFYAVVEPQEYDAYLKAVGGDKSKLLVLPWNGNDKVKEKFAKDRGIDSPRGVTPARNWIHEHAIASGAKRHWQLDDNMKLMRRWYKQRRIPVNANIALRATEDFADRYTNVGIAGLNYTMFSFTEIGDNAPITPFVLNAHVYSCSLISNELPYRFRLAYNEDTDLCLQILAAGLCTVQMNCFTVDKMPTLKLSGGNMAEMYRENGRLKMARSLERMWPGVVETKRRFGRAQHVIKFCWRRFDTPLIRRTDIDWKAMEKKGTNEYGMKLVQNKAKIKSASMKRMLEASK